MPVTVESAPTGSMALGSRRIPIRALIFWAGVTFWIGNTILHTGGAGITALWSSFLFLAEIIVITIATRTSRLEQVRTLYCLGGAMMSVMWLVAYGFTMLEPDGNAFSRKVFVPFMEESLKLAPVIFVLWRQRQTRLWSIGASDICLMAAASGAGFSLVEDAFVQHSSGVWRAVDWLPTTDLTSASLTVGHPTWTSLAGATLGLAFLWRPRKPFAYLLGASGFLWSVFDHFSNNLAAASSPRHPGALVNFVNFVRGYGWVSFYFFWIALVVVVVADLYVILRVLPPCPELKTPTAGLLSFSKGATPVWKSLILTWEFLLTKRALAFMSFHYRQEPPSVRSGLLDPILYSLAQTLFRLSARRHTGVLSVVPHQNVAHS